MPTNSSVYGTISSAYPTSSSTYDTSATWAYSNIEPGRDEMILLKALTRLLVDTDLFYTLMDELGIDADAALATAFRGNSR